MAVQTSYPGVYIDEFAPGAPIEGVGTSTAAFVGVAERGDINEPTKLASWDAFKRTFGELPVPGFFLWYTVRGFFENGGQLCYVVRASNGSYTTWDLVTTPGAGAPAVPTVRLRARQPGSFAPGIAVTAVQRLTGPNSQLFRPTGTTAAAAVGAFEVTLQPAGPLPAPQGPEVAGRFRPGDVVTFGGATRHQIVRIRGDVLGLGSPLGAALAAATPVRLANAPAGARTVRVTTTAPVANEVLVPGAVLTLAQGASNDTVLVDDVLEEHLPGGVTTWRVTFRQPLAIGIDFANPTTVASNEFDLVVQPGPSPIAEYRNLSIDSAHPRWVVRVVNDDPDGPMRARPTEPPPVRPLVLLLPQPGAVAAVAGTNEVVAQINQNHYIAALETLRAVDDVNLVAAPEALQSAAIAAAVQVAVLDHCQQLGDRFAVLDARPALPLFGAGSVMEQRAGVSSGRGYAALYYPWVRVRPVGTGEPILVPPSGHVCGIMARSDATRGVHKAPANEIVGGSLGVERTMSDVEQGQLNRAGINVIRVFASGARPVVWGARTTATDTNWQYVNIRRLFLYLEESIDEGIRWAVFEPNNLQLWQKLRRTIRDFLLRAWRDGALFGATPEEAFYVRIDEALNPFSEQQLGRLHIEVGVRPSYPAEFIIVRIGIWAGGSSVDEA